MKKQITNAFNKKAYLLGKDEEGILYWLEEGKFDCQWYWSIGYIETYTNNENPSISKDINSHSHFDNMFLNNKNNKNSYDNFKEFFIKTPLNDSEIWVLIELMKTLYTVRNYSNTIYKGGSNFTNNPCKYIIKNENEYKRINEIVIPKLLSEIYNLLSN